MRLLICRHGEAFNVGDHGISRDFDRKLTPNGENQIKSVSGAMKSLGINPDLILTSPYVRTLATANIFSESLGCVKPIVASLLQSGFKTDQLDELFSEYELWEKYLGKTVLMVGHMPDVGRICDVFLSIKGFYFEPGNLAMIQFNGATGIGTLISFITPELYRA